jgi:hypothetical protein
MIDLKPKFPRMFSLIEDVECSERENHAIYAMCLTIDNHEKALEQKWNEDVDHVVFQQIFDGGGNVRVYYKGGNQYCHGVVRMFENYMECKK